MPFSYVPPPTGQKFLDSTSFIKGIAGPVGSGKSTVALMDLFHRAVTQTAFNNVRRTRFCLLRNTLPQLRDTVKPLIDTWFVTLADGKLGRWRSMDNTFEMRFLLGDGTEVFSEFLLLAADTPDDVRRLLSLELSAAWVEEAREVAEEVFQGLTARVGRMPSRVAGGVAYPGVIFSTNMPAIGTFWHGMISSPPANADVFTQPSALLDDNTVNPQAENLVNLSDNYYANLIDGKSDEWIAVYLRNQFGVGNAGMPVFRGAFKRSFHVASAPLQPVASASYPLLLGMDNGLQAAACVLQRDARGRVNVLDECYVPAEQTMGVETFLDRMLLPRLRERFAAFRKEHFIFILDPACFQRSQVNEKTIAQAVRERGYVAVQAPTQNPERRVQAVEQLLALQVDGGPGLRFDPRCTYLAEALEWGYRYKKGASGGGLTFAKTHHSHLAEAIQYACLHINNVGEAVRTGPQRREVVPAAYAYASGVAGPRPAANNLLRVGA